jgi:hypothetical protein
MPTGGMKNPPDHTMLVIARFLKPARESRVKRGLRAACNIEFHSTRERESIGVVNDATRLVEKCRATG